MTSIERNFTQAVEVFRLQPTDVNGKRIIAPVAVISTQGVKMPARENLQELLPGNFSEVAMLLMPLGDVRKGDKITVDGVEYRVAIVRVFDQLRTNKHLEVIIHSPTSL